MEARAITIAYGLAGARHLAGKGATLVSGMAVRASEDHFIESMLLLRTSMLPEERLGIRTGANFDSIIFGYYDTGKLIYAGRTRNGFTPSSPQPVVQAIQGHGDREMRVRHLPEARSARWGYGLPPRR